MTAQKPTPEEVWLQIGFGDEGQTTWCDHSTGWEPEIGPYRLTPHPAPALDSERGDVDRVTCDDVLPLRGEEHLQEPLTRSRIDWWWLCKKLAYKREELRRLNAENAELRAALSPKAAMDVEALKRENLRDLPVDYCGCGNVDRGDYLDYLASNGHLKNAHPLFKVHPTGEIETVIEPPPGLTEAETQEVRDTLTGLMKARSYRNSALGLTITSEFAPKAEDDGCRKGD